MFNFRFFSHLSQFPTQNSFKPLHAVSMLIFLLPFLLRSFVVEGAPQFESVGSGQATVTQNSADTTINQITDSITLNWSGFDINSNERVIFNQPSNSAIAINNITGQTPSQIFGSITANGRIVLLNPQGFYFGAASSVSANTFIVATTQLNNITYHQATNSISYTAIDASTIVSHGTITTTNKTILVAKDITLDSETTLTAASSIIIRATKDIVLQGALTTTANHGSVDLFADSGIVGRGVINTDSLTIDTNYLSLAGSYTALDLITIHSGTMLLNSTASFTTQRVSTSSTDFSLISASISAEQQHYSSATSITLLSATLMGRMIEIGAKKTPIITIDSNTKISVAHETTPGSIIIFANETASIDGVFNANSIYGNGGFIELSAKQLQLSQHVQISVASNFQHSGTIVIDPDIVIIKDIPSPTEIFKSLISGYGNPLPSNPLFSNLSWDGHIESIASSNTHILIGTPKIYYGRGNAYLFIIATNTWVDLATVINSPVPGLPANSNFGVSVALNSTFALIGADKISTYKLTGGSGDEIVFHGDAFLYRIDGTNVFNASCQTSAVYQVTGLNSPWCALSDTSDSPVLSLSSLSNFGFTVALSSTFALIGAPGVATKRGDVYLYKLDGTMHFNATCETTAVTGAFAITSPWCTLSSTDTNPSTTGKQNPIVAGSTYAQFGNALALNASFALLSGNNDVVIYSLSGNNAFTASCATTGTLTSTWCSLSATDTDTTTTGNQNPIVDVVHYEIFSLALNSTYALIGTPAVSDYRGDAYLYRIDGTNVFNATCQTSAVSGATGFNSPWCSLSATDTDTTTTGKQNPILDLANGYGSFGRSVALNNTYALIGADGSPTGNAYLYKIDGTNVFNASCQTSAVSGATGFNTPWCNLSSTDIDTSATGKQNPILVNQLLIPYFGASVSLNTDSAIILGYNSFLIYNLNQSNCSLFPNNANSFWCSYQQSDFTVISNFSNSIALSDTHALFVSNPTTQALKANIFLLNLTNGNWLDLSTTAQNPFASLGLFISITTDLNATYALIAGNAYQGNIYSGSSPRAFLYRLDGTNSFATHCATSGAPLTTPWCDLTTTDTNSSLQGNQNPLTALGVISDLFLNYPVALNDTYALIGAPGVATNRGDAYLYRLDGARVFNSTCQTSAVSGATGFNSPWCILSSSESESVTSLDPGSNFGYSVALNATYALFGTPGYDNPLSSGEAFLYRLDGANVFNYTCQTSAVSGATGFDSPWCILSSSESEPITSLDSGSSFGHSVALNATYALIGAPDAANVYLYKLDGVSVFNSTCQTSAVAGASGFNTPWCTLSMTDTDSTTAGNQNPITSFTYPYGFGSSVALNDTYALIGFNYYSSILGGNGEIEIGAAFLYKLNGTNTFNTSCQTSAVAGATGFNSPWCALYDTPANPSNSLTEDSEFGNTVALNATYALLSAEGSINSKGNAFFYKLDGTACNIFNSTNRYPWCGVVEDINTLPTNINQITTNNAAKYTLALSEDSSYLLIGISNYYDRVATALLYNLQSNTWLDLSSIANQPFSALALNSNVRISVALNSSYALIGAVGVATDRGNAYLYRLDGTSVFNSTCQTSAVAGASGFNTPWCALSSSASQPITTLAANSFFGFSVALNSTYALIAAPGVATDRGNAYLYRLDGTS
ncbi:MAG: filamentous hemagglutinin N-terminal domain-containing protein, partial [Methylacidiphilales bacterium]|nr:filamentous hemagglutinin N-terminal domain-containing protein [Candidatus Methylacidiphilales bacterium]